MTNFVTQKARDEQQGHHLYVNDRTTCNNMVVLCSESLKFQLLILIVKHHSMQRGLDPLTTSCYNSKIYK